MNETDFVNVYIEQLTKALHDAVSRNVILETKLVMATKLVESLQVELGQVKSSMEKIKKKINTE